MYLFLLFGQKFATFGCVKVGGVVEMIFINVLKLRDLLFRSFVEEYRMK